MKKGILITITVGLALCLLMGASTNKVQPPKHWQDVLLRLDQPWLNAYGYSPESVLAYNDWQQNIAIQNANRKILALEKLIAAVTKRVDAIEKPVVEPKEVTAEDPNAVE